MVRVSQDKGLKDEKGETAMNAFKTIFKERREQKYLYKLVK